MSPRSPFSIGFHSSNSRNYRSSNMNHHDVELANWKATHTYDL
ncbi:unnamed protein product [Amoebophrya sp. A25]|nr:unnamed protein product [Amoebophrya sp. A25]|eukprot:GSA25T00011981001.1